MKHIQKGAEPIELTEFRNRRLATATMPTWRDLEGEALVVEALRRHLFADELQREEYDKLVDNLVERDREGKYAPFCITLVAALSFFRQSPTTTAIQ